MRCPNCRAKMDKTDYGFWDCPKCDYSTGGKTFADWNRFDMSKRDRERLYKKNHRQRKWDQW